MIDSFMVGGCGLVGVLNKPRSVCAQVRSDVGPVCSAEYKLFTKDTRCGLVFSVLSAGGNETSSVLASEIIDRIC